MKLVSLYNANKVKQRDAKILQYDHTKYALKCNDDYVAFWDGRQHVINRTCMNYSKQVKSSIVAFFECENNKELTNKIRKGKIEIMDSTPFLVIIDAWNKLDKEKGIQRSRNGVK